MNRHALLLATILGAGSAIPFLAADEAPPLQQIMQALRDNLVEVTNGLLTGDLERVARGAVAIAEHPTIAPEQMQRVAAELGEEMAVFKAFDTVVHDSSLEIAAAASAGDEPAALAAYRSMVDGCFGCHSSYKDRISAVLRPAK